MGEINITEEDIKCVMENNVYIKASGKWIEELEKFRKLYTGKQILFAEYGGKKYEVVHIRMEGDGEELIFNITLGDEIE